MEYMTVSQAAVKWNISQRQVHQYCLDGRVAGAKRLGRAWAIPADTVKPTDPRRAAKLSKASAITPFPLINTAIPPGSVSHSIEAIANADERSLALAEYYYFTGRMSEAVELCEKYLESSELSLRLTACLIYGYASLAVNAENIYKALEIADAAFHALDENTPDKSRALTVFVCCSMYTLLHLPRPKELPEMQQYIKLLPIGLRYFALYVQSRFAYINGLYIAAIGCGETLLVLDDKTYPLPIIYMHLICAMGYMHTPYKQLAIAHTMEAWELARADGLYQPFAELHGFLGGAIEASIKQTDPTAYRRIIALTGQFSMGWRQVHNALSGDEIPTELTANEFIIASLAARNWSYKQIGAHLGISKNTVKSSLHSARRKLDIPQGKTLNELMRV